MAARKSNPVLFVYLPPQLHEQLRRHAERAGERVSVFVRQLLRRELESTGHKPAA